MTYESTTRNLLRGIVVLSAIATASSSYVQGHSWNFSCGAPGQNSTATYTTTLETDNPDITSFVINNTVQWGNQSMESGVHTLNVNETYNFVYQYVFEAGAGRQNVTLTSHRYGNEEFGEIASSETKTIDIANGKCTVIKFYDDDEEENIEEDDDISGALGMSYFASFVMSLISISAAVWFD